MKNPVEREAAGAGGDDWPLWFREAAEGFEHFVAGLPAEARAEALRRGRDALDRLAAELAGATAKPADFGAADIIGAAPDGGA